MSEGIAEASKNLGLSNSYEFRITFSHIDLQVILTDQALYMVHIQLDILYVTSKFYQFKACSNFFQEFVEYNSCQTVAKPP